MSKIDLLVEQVSFEYEVNNHKSSRMEHRINPNREYTAHFPNLNQNVKYLTIIFTFYKETGRMTKTFSYKMLMDHNVESKTYTAHVPFNRHQLKKYISRKITGDFHNHLQTDPDYFGGKEEILRRQKQREQLERLQLQQQKSAD